MDYLTFKVEDYENYLNRIEHTYSDILKELSEMVYITPKKYNETNCLPEEKIVEDEKIIKMPIFCECMNKFIFNNGKIPTQTEFTDFYISDNFKYFNSHNMLTDNYLYAIRNRCSRAYPSLIRDFVFGKYLQEKLPKTCDIIWNPILDTKCEIDIMICGKNGNWGIHLYTNTFRGNLYRYKKNYRKHIEFNNVTHIDLPINLDDCLSINNLKLYTDKQLNDLIKIVRKNGK